MTEIRMTLEDAQILDRSEIIRFTGASGCTTLAAIAFEAPALCQMRSSAGDTFNLSRDGDMLVATKVEAR